MKTTPGTVLLYDNHNVIWIHLALYHTDLELPRMSNNFTTVNCFVWRYFDITFYKTSQVNCYRACTTQRVENNILSIYCTMNSELRREPGVIFFFDIETYKLWIYFTLYRTVKDVAWAYLDIMIDVTSEKNYYALFIFSPEVSGMSVITHFTSSTRHLKCKIFYLVRYSVMKIRNAQYSILVCT